MTSSTTVSPGQALVNLVESDLAVAGGTPLVQLLTNLQVHAGNNLAQGADILASVPALAAAGFSLEVEVEQQLLGLAIAKVQAYIASKTVPAPVAAVAVAAA